MPKEVIRDQNGAFDVHVAWGRDTEVVVGVVSRNERALNTILEHGEHSIWSTFNRATCNHLIRTIRRARDQAFGRDE